MRVLCLIAAMLFVGTEVRAQETADTFEVVSTRQDPRIPTSSPILLEADGITLQPGNAMVELRRGASLVAVFPYHQIVLVGHRSVTGGRAFWVETPTGSYEISADYMQSAPHNQPILFWVGETLVGVVNGGQVVAVTDRAARVQGG